MFPSPVAPQTYITQSLCSPVPMFRISPSPMFPSRYVPQPLCSPVHLFSIPYRCSPVPMLPSPYVPQTNSTVPMFPTSIPQKFPFPIFPKYVPQCLCSPVPIFPQLVRQFLYSPFRISLTFPHSICSLSQKSPEVFPVRCSANMSPGPDTPQSSPYVL